MKEVLIDMWKAAKKYWLATIIVLIIILGNIFFKCEDKVAHRTVIDKVITSNKRGDPKFILIYNQPTYPYTNDVWVKPYYYYKTKIGDVEEYEYTITYFRFK